MREEWAFKAPDVFPPLKGYFIRSLEEALAIPQDEVPVRLPPRSHTKLNWKPQRESAELLASQATGFLSVGPSLAGLG